MLSKGFEETLFFLFLFIRILFSSRNSEALHQYILNVPLLLRAHVNLMYLLSDYLRQPLPELRIAAFGLLRSLANYDWGIKFMFDHPGFLEFLLHRDSETTKLGKEWKYSIVEAVVRNPWTKQRKDSSLLLYFLPTLQYLLIASLLDMQEAEFRKLARYAQQGVFYVAAEAHVEVDKQHS